MSKFVEDKPSDYMAVKPPPGKTGGIKPPPVPPADPGVTKSPTALLRPPAPGPRKQ